ncbi:MAG: DUF4835 family protein [Bacteroidetes bacterium]|nr:DUF4835 family protein [Bacteroidota bacterium]
MMIKKGQTFFLLILFSVQLFSQELNVNVNVISPRVQSTDKHVYDNMRDGINEFLRTTVWTEDEFQANERIECSFHITISDRISTDRFKGKLQVSSVRPIFNTSINSPLFNFQDDNFVFDYVEYEKIEFVEGSFTSNLAAVLSFYIYYILGLDYDSYSRLGGSEYFKKAQSIVNIAQGKDYPGWDNFTTKKNNRFWLIDQTLDNIHKPLREINYSYHRLGLDIMYVEKETGRNVILEALEKLKKIYRDEPSSFLLSVYLSTKRSEIINIFTGATTAEKETMIDLAKEIDAAKSSDYSEKLK